jgi:hypothetical protein
MDFGVSGSCTESRGEAKRLFAYFDDIRRVSFVSIHLPMRQRGMLAASSTPQTEPAERQFNEPDPFP